MENIEKSTEVRWFFQKTLPREVYTWFMDKSHLGETLLDVDGDEREDLYLLATGSPNLSPKLREGKFEIKFKDPKGELPLSDGKFSGKGEDWTKWKWRYADVKDKKGEFDKAFATRVLEAFLGKTDETFRHKVWKKRWIRKFKVNSNGELEPVSKGDRVEDPYGIQSEVTQLKIDEQEWWTIAAEIFGDYKDLKNPMEFLNQSVHWILQDYSGPALKNENSYSYPELLCGK